MAPGFEHLAAITGANFRSHWWCKVTSIFTLQDMGHAQIFRQTFIYLSLSEKPFTMNADIPEMPKTFPDLVKTVALLDAKQGVECVLFQAK
jgi:hypothetical protein